MQNLIDPQIGSSNGWFLGINNRQVGPMDSVEIARMARSGSVTGETLVWRAGMANWQPARGVAELASIFGVVAPPPVQPPPIQPSPIEAQPQPRTEETTPADRCPEIPNRSAASESSLDRVIKTSPLAVVTGPFLLALFCFLLPFVQVSCQGNRGPAVSLSGLQVTFGTRIDDRKVESSPLMMAVLGCAAVGLLSALSRRGKSGSPFAVISGVAGFICVVAFYLKTSSHLQQESQGAILIEPRIGFYLICLSLIAGSILNGLRQRSGTG